MKFQSDIRVCSCSSEDVERVEQLFSSEDKNIINNRATFELIVEADPDNTDLSCLRFHLEAKDATALRAVFTMVVKVLSVFEKTKNLIAESSNNSDNNN